jgi:hypothetical protein
MLSGDAQPFGPVDEHTLERAKQNLTDGLVVFGLMERLDESLVLAKRRLGLRSILAPPARVNTERPRGDAVLDDMREAAERGNQYDIELYRHAEAVFEAAPERAELEFSVELAAMTIARAADDADPSVPAPPGYAGDEHSWQLLVRTTAAALRNARDVAGVNAMVQAVLLHGDRAVDFIAKMSPDARETRWPGAAARELTELLLSRRTARLREEDTTSRTTPAADFDNGTSRTKADRRATRKASRKRNTRGAAKSATPPEGNSGSRES